MRTTNILDKISDGRLYDIEDVVKADTCGCDGCSDCCKDVGDLVVLTPFDIYEMTTYLNLMANITALISSSIIIANHTP